MLFFLNIWQHMARSPIHRGKYCRECNRGFVDKQAYQQVKFIHLALFRMNFMNHSIRNLTIHCITAGNVVACLVTRRAVIWWVNSMAWNIHQALYGSVAYRKLSCPSGWPHEESRSKLLGWSYLQAGKWAYIVVKGLFWYPPSRLSRNAIILHQDSRTA